MRYALRNQHGLSLMEVMIALTLGLFVIGAIVGVFISSTTGYKTQDSMASLQENARFALMTLQRDIRMAGYRGCLGGRNDTPIPILIRNNLANPTSFINNFSLGLEGFEASSSAWSPNLDSSLSGAVPAPTTGNDIIAVRIATGAGVALNAIMANSSVDLPVASTAGLGVGVNAILEDCVAATVFQVTGLPGGTAVSHTVGASTNTTADMGRAFSTDATVQPISTVTYYVAPSSNAPTGSETSLWQRTNNTSLELAEGVENMQILYGEDTNGDLSPDRYVTANNVANMDNVIAVQLSLLMRTIDNNVSVAGQKYTFNGVANKTPPDKRVRRVFTTTISLRNRTN